MTKGTEVSNRSTVRAKGQTQSYTEEHKKAKKIGVKFRVTQRKEEKRKMQVQSRIYP
jgi:hypothetical protein